MTISAYSPKSYHPGSAMLAEAIGFAFLDVGEVIVTHEAAADGALTVLALDTDYEIAGDGYAGTATVRALAAWPAGDWFHVTRATEEVQAESLPEHGPLPSKKIERALDRAMMVIQEQGKALRRALKWPMGSEAVTLPAKALFAGKLWGGDANGNPVPVTPPAGEDLALRGDLALNNGTDLVGGPDGSLQDMLNARPAQVFSRSDLKALDVVRNKAAYLIAAGRSGLFWLKIGTPPVSDPQEGLYLVSNTAGYYWERDWDGVYGIPEWCGAVANSNTGGIPAANVVAIHAALKLFAEVRALCADYYVNATVKANEAWMKLRGGGEKYNAVTGKVTRIITSSATTPICQIGADSDPGGGTNSYPQGIEVSDIYFTRSVAPTISSNCVGVRTQFALYAKLKNLKSNGSMIGFQEGRTVHCHKTNCEAVRDNAGTGAGTDYFVGHEAEGSNPFGAGLGANASLYHHDCVANCNYGPLQTATNSIGFKSDHFQDVWYFNPETTNFYIGQAFFGNDLSTLEFSNADCKVFHPIHDQFKFAGTYAKDVNAAGAVSIVEPYYGPSAGARSGHFVDSCEGNVSLRGGQFLMGVAPGCQPITLVSSRGANILGYPVIIEAGNTYPAVGAADCADTIIEVTGRNPTVSAGALVQLSGTSENVYVAPQASGKAAAFQYGIQVTGTPVRCTFDVSRINSAAMQAVDRQLNVLAAAITSAGPVAGATSCIAQGNFN